MNPPTDTQLDEIATRAASLHEYAVLDDAPFQADADQLTGTDVPVLLAEIRRLRAKAREYGELAARREAKLIALRAERAATQTKVLATEADEIVAHCPDHGSRDGVWITCHCDVADDMRRRAGAAVASG